MFNTRAAVAITPDGAPLDAAAPALAALDAAAPPPTAVTSANDLPAETAGASTDDGDTENPPPSTELIPAVESGFAVEAASDPDPDLHLDPDPGLLEVPVDDGGDVASAEAVHAALDADEQPPGPQAVRADETGPQAGGAGIEATDESLVEPSLPSTAEDAPPSSEDGA
jgi:hypothetical protein